MGQCQGKNLMSLILVSIMLQRKQTAGANNGMKLEDEILDLKDKKSK